MDWQSIVAFWGLVALIATILFIAFFNLLDDAMANPSRVPPRCPLPDSGGRIHDHRFWQPMHGLKNHTLVVPR